MRLITFSMSWSAGCPSGKDVERHPFILRAKSPFGRLTQPRGNIYLIKNKLGCSFFNIHNGRVIYLVNYILSSQTLGSLLPKKKAITLTFSFFIL